MEEMNIKISKPNFISSIDDKKELYLEAEKYIDK
jgi:hypothetical protein